MPLTKESFLAFLATKGEKNIEITHLYELPQIMHGQYSFGYLTPSEFEKDLDYVSGIVRWSNAYRILMIDFSTRIRYKM